MQNYAKARIKKPIKEVAEKDEIDIQRDIMQKLNFIECKSLRGNMSSKNLIEFFDIVQDADNGTATDEELAKRVDKLYSKVR